MKFINKINDNQFGYKRKTSCKNAYFAVNEAINFYRRKKSNFFLFSLDASKAFDKLWRCGLFFKLINELDPKKVKIIFLNFLSPKYQN